MRLHIITQLNRGGLCVTNERYTRDDFHASNTILSFRNFRMHNGYVIEMWTGVEHEYGFRLDGDLRTMFQNEGEEMVHEN